MDSDLQADRAYRRFGERRIASVRIGGINGQRFSVINAIPRESIDNGDKRGPRQVRADGTQCLSHRRPAGCGPSASGRHSSSQACIPSRGLRMRKNSFGACSLSMARCWLPARERAR